MSVFKYIRQTMITVTNRLKKELELQLVINLIQREANVKTLLDKARTTARMFSKLPLIYRVAAGSTGVFLNDCPTRWSDKVNMVSCFLQVKEMLWDLANQEK